MARQKFRLLPVVEVLNDRPRVAIIQWLWWNWLYREPKSGGE
jgi:hypothetical protein